MMRIRTIMTAGAAETAAAVEGIVKRKTECVKPLWATLEIKSSVRLAFR